MQRKFEGRLTKFVPHPKRITKVILTIEAEATVADYIDLARFYLEPGSITLYAFQQELPLRSDGHQIRLDDAPAADGATERETAESDLDALQEALEAENDALQEAEDMAGESDRLGDDEIAERVAIEVAAGLVPEDEERLAPADDGLIDFDQVLGPDLYPDGAGWASKERV